MAVISPCFQSVGTFPSLSDSWKIVSNGCDICWASSLSSLGCNPSGPGALDILSCSIFFFIFSRVISMLDNHSLKLLWDRFGMLLVSSSVNTLLKKSASTSAFSLSLAVLVSSPSSSSYTRSGISCLIFVFLLTYCQNYLGFVLDYFAMSRSIFFLAFLVRFFTWLLRRLYSMYFSPDRVSMYLCQHLCFFLIFLIIFSS